MHIREFRHTDIEAVAALFTASVHGLAGAHYTAEQLQAWAPQPPDLDRWRQKLAGQKVLLAEHDAELLGMIGYEPDGHIDVLFTHPDHVRKGVAARLHGEVMRALREHDVRELFTEASEVARPFFERLGYVVERRETVQTRGVDLHRYRMRRISRPGIVDTQ